MVPTIRRGSPIGAIGSIARDAIAQQEGTDSLQHDTRCKTNYDIYKRYYFQHMINPDEMVFCVDEQNTPIDSLPRSIVHRDHVWHRSTDIWVVDPSHTKVLCHKRSSQKDTHPGLFDSTFGGHMLDGETPIHNAMQELSEELGIVVDPAKFEFIATFPDPNQYEFLYRYLYSFHGDSTQLIFEKEEIDEIFWSDVTELSTIYKERVDPRWVYRMRESEMIEMLRSS